MKKITNIIIILFVTVALFISEKASAQVKYGPVVGFNGSSLDGLNLGVGFNAGVFAEVEILDRFSWRPEFIFSNRGSSQTSDGANPVTVNYRISSGDLSILSFIVPFSNNLNAHIGTRSSSFRTGTLSSSDSNTTEDLFSGDVTGLFGGVYVGLMYETVSGLILEARFTTAGSDGDGGGDLSGAYTEFMINASYKISW